MSSMDVQRTLAGTRLRLVDLGQRAAAYLLLLVIVRSLGHRIGIAAGTGVCAHTKLTIAPEFALQQFHAGGGGLQFHSGFKQRPAV
jgi:hypothetical protein